MEMLGASSNLGNKTCPHKKVAARDRPKGCPSRARARARALMGRRVEGEFCSPGRGASECQNSSSSSSSQSSAASPPRPACATWCARGVHNKPHTRQNRPNVATLRWHIPEVWFCCARQEQAHPAAKKPCRTQLSAAVCGAVQLLHAARYAAKCRSLQQTSPAPLPCQQTSPAPAARAGTHGGETARRARRSAQLRAENLEARSGGQRTPHPAYKALLSCGTTWRAWGA